LIGIFPKEITNLKKIRNELEIKFGGKNGLNLSLVKVIIVKIHAFDD
jgi:hypothetical protein